MESLYKVGDKVKIREDLQEGSYSNIWCLDCMADRRGEIATITSVEPHTMTDRGYVYYIDIMDYMWTDTMFEPLRRVTDEEKQKTLEVSDFLLEMVERYEQV